MSEYHPLVGATANCIRLLPSSIGDEASPKSATCGAAEQLPLTPNPPRAVPCRVDPYYIVTCGVVSCSAVSCRTVPCLVSCHLLCRVSCRVIYCSVPCHVVPNRSVSAIPYRALPCRGRSVSCRAVSCHTVSCPAASFRSVPCRAVSVISCRVVPCRSVSCRVSPCRVRPSSVHHSGHRGLQPAGVAAGHHKYDRPGRRPSDVLWPFPAAAVKSSCPAEHPTANGRRSPPPARSKRRRTAPEIMSRNSSVCHKHNGV